MNVLVLGGTGMLGHKIFQTLQRCIPDSWCTVRGTSTDPRLQRTGLFSGGNVIWELDVEDCSPLKELLFERCPRVIVNCAGVIKQRTHSKAAIPNIQINALLPHKLAAWCEAWQGRLIHFSTDCVFSGRRGSYSEEDLSDAEDIYGKSKFLGEVTTENALTLRTSIIGRELSEFKSLLEWFFQQNHQKVMGYTQALYSGITTNYLAGLIAKIILEQPALSGLYQVTGPTISKYDLLCQIRNAFALEVEIEPDYKFFCDRSMSGEKFAQATGYRTPAWPELLADLRSDPTPYEKWR
jgi:dTDP-4-dehydrorhamnose reductase